MEQSTVVDKPTDVAPDATIVNEEEELGYKVFVGNLDFATTESNLEEYFGTIGKVKKSHIIKRGTRSLGYGFVTYESKDDASKASTEFNKKEFDGRELDVQLAKPKNETRQHSTAGNYGTRTNGGNNTRGNFRSRGPRGGFRGRGRGGRNDHTERHEGGGSEEVGEGEERKFNVERGGRGGSGRGNTGRGGYRAGYRGGRGGRIPRIPKGEPSETLLFVTNLPFSLDDQGLKKVFNNFTVISAKVVRGPKDRSKGFGFVELKSHQEQQDAIENLKNIEIEGRKLVLKIARVDQREVEEDNANEEQNDDSKVTTTTTTDVPVTTSA